MKRWMVIGALLLCCVGCATTPYTNPSATEEDAKRVAVKCRALAEQGVPPGGLGRGWLVENQYRLCVEGEGYVRAPR